MKLRTIAYTCKEGLGNAYRNKLMSFISMGMVAVSLMVFGIYFIIMTNVNSNISAIKQNYQIMVYCLPSLTYNDPLVDQIEDAIKNNPNVASYVKISKEEAFESLKNGTLDDSSFMDGMDNSFLPIAFSVTLKDFSLGGQTGDEFEKLPNVNKVLYPKQEIDAINTMANFIYITSILIGAVLALSAIFIISNTIRLTVFSRKREINIMKYVGASDTFVRLPFLIEGVIMGLLGSLIAFFVISYSYVTIIKTVNDKLQSMNIVSLKLLDISNMAPFMFVSMVAIGVLVGIAGSVISVRRHLKV